MTWLFKKLMDRILAGAIHQGSFRVIWPDGSQNRYGNGIGPQAGVHITNEAYLRRLVQNPGLAIGEAYMDEGIVPLDCSMYEVLALLMQNVKGRRVPVLELNAWIGRLLRPLLQANGAARSKRNVAHHYDLNGRL